jgi:hypothetical protein
VVFAAELSRRYGDEGIVSTSVNPGKTSFGHSAMITLLTAYPHRKHQNRHTTKCQQFSENSACL